jgi:DNA-binding NtrC family response regulator
MTFATARFGDTMDPITAATILYFTGAAPERAGVRSRLMAMGLTVTPVPSLRDALAILTQRSVTLCLIDLADARAAVPTIRAIRAQDPDLPISALIASTRPLVTADALHAGVTDLLTWPFEERDIAAIVANARDREGIQLPVPAAPAAQINLFAHSAVMRQVVEAVRSAGEAAGGVVICGESGTGRELVARSVHSASQRSQGAFQRVECSGQSPDELEYTLFGTVADKRHAGPGRRAVERITRHGAIHQALGGTLFLANVLDTPDRIQAKLARLLRDHEATLNEKRATIPIDVRFMASLDASPEAAVADDRLRGDLAERLSHSRIDVPPLRRRREDIPVLAVHLLADLGRAEGRTPQRFTRSALALLAALPWPGNGRELRSVLETLVRSVRRSVIEIDDLFEHIRLDGVSARLDASGTLKDARARFERDWISAVLIKHHGRVGDAARALGIQRTNLYRKVRQLNVARTLLSSRRA